jgi:hypothetical protein
MTHHDKMMATGGNAFLGGLIGMIFAAFGNLISSSTPGVVITILVSSILGGELGQFLGMVMGSILGILGVAFGSLISQSVLGIVLTIGIGAFLLGWGTWVTRSRKETLSTPLDYVRSSPKKPYPGKPSVNGEMHSFHIYCENSSMQTN